MAKKTEQKETQEKAKTTSGSKKSTAAASEGKSAAKKTTSKAKTAKEDGKATAEQQAGTAATSRRGRPKKSEAADTGSAAQEVTTKSKKAPSTKTKAKDTSGKAPKEAGGLSIEPAPVAPQAEEEQTGPVYFDISRFSEFDVYLFREGRHYTLYDKFGSHLMEHRGERGAYFAVWAPNAEQVSVMGDFNSWNRDSHHLQARGDHSGIWEGFIPDVQAGMLYKYHIKSKYNLYHVEKSDPFALRREKPPQTASVVHEMHHTWEDNEWLQQRKNRQGQPQPYSVYELHVGSWRRKPEDNNRPLTYRELAEELPAYVREMGFTHVEFMPVMHHPFNGSWGYQITGYFAAASPYGSPEDLMYLIDCLHRQGIGVIMDWVPSHFPSDEHGLAYFDGTHLFEHADPRKGYHPDWKSYIFNYGRNEVRSFLISNALFWLDRYHVDGLRVDAVASMLYLDYSRKHDEWIPNEFGGRENLEAISLLKEFNQAVHEKFPDTLTIAEESTAWPAVTGPVENGGLGFDMKWMMGWMHDTLTYFSKDPVYRRHHQGDITFSIIYAFTERFMLPLSHDEVVHGKGSLIRKMPGDEWQAFANLRAMYGYMYAHPGAKLLFMGAELAQSTEWNHDSSLDWHLLQFKYHTGVKELVRQLNHLYKQEPGLYAHSFDQSGFEWIDFADAHNSVMSFMRKGNSLHEQLLVVCNFTPAVHENYRLGVPLGGNWVEVFNSDDSHFGGSGFHNHGVLQSVADSFHGRDYSIVLKLPPMSVVYFKFQPMM